MPEASLDALLAHAPVGIGFLDDQLRVARANEALTLMVGRSEVLVGRSLPELTAREDLLEIAERALRDGEPAFDVPIQAALPDGGTFQGLAGYYPVRDAQGTITGVGVVVRDITESVQAAAEREALLTRVTRLQEITGALAAARTMDEVGAVVLEDVRRATGAAAVSLCNVDGDEIEVLASEGYSERTLAPWRRFPLDSPAPLADAVLQGVPVVARGREEIVLRWPGIAASLGPDRKGLVALPMVVDGVARGAIGLSFDEELVVDDDELSFLTSLATQCAGAFHRVRLHEAAQAAADRLAFLAEASDVLASSLDWTDTLRAVTELAVPRLADIAAVFTIDDDRITTLEVVDRDADRVEHVRGLLQRWPDALRQEGALEAIARHGGPVLASGIGPAELDAMSRDLERRAAQDAADFESVLIVPMPVQGRTVGLILLADRAPRVLTDDDRALARDLATRAGQAMVNAELFRERSEVAATLQASLLPPATPSVPGLDVASRFFALGAGIEVGGDFYDVFRLGTLHEPDDRWALVIGDVRGKGTVAATVSGAARHAIRVAALRERSPAAVLERVNELLLVMAGGTDLEPRFCTVALAVVEPGPDGARARIASAGHPAPMILRADGSTELVTVEGALLGVLPDPGLVDVPVELQRGDALVLYTDGVTERHVGTRFFDEDGLRSVLSRCHGFTASALAERIETASRAFVDEALRDDLAILVARVPEDVAVSGPTSLDLPSDLTAPSLARRFVAAALESRGLAHLTDTAALLASELVTNAVVHGEGPVRISLVRQGEVLRVEVSDATSTLPKVREADPVRTHGRGMAIIESFADRWGSQPQGATPGKVVWVELRTT